MPNRSAVATLSLLLACADSGELPEVGSTASALSVTWTNAVGVTASGNDLTKSSATAGWNAGASSVETLSGDGFVEFTTAEATTAKAAGLGNGDVSRSYTDIEFAIQLRANGTLAVYESGALRGSFGAYVAGDLFRVEVTAGVVRYKKNGVTLYASALAPTFPLVVDTSLNTPGATINDVVLVSTGLDWQNAVGVAVSGRNLTKTITGTWNAGASSVQALSGDGFLEFTTGENTTGKMVGLSSDDASLHYSDIDFAIYLKANGAFTVYEGGVARASSFGSYLAGDVFRIEVAGGVVTYSTNGGVPFYTSAVTPAATLRVDTSFLTSGGTVQNVTLTEAANACPAYDGSGTVCSGSFVVNNSFDLAEIAGCANITGNLTFDAPGMSEIALPAVQRVGGNLTVYSNSGLVRVRFPQLKDLGGSFALDGPLGGVQGLDLSRLKSAGVVQIGLVGIDLYCLESADTLIASAEIPRLRSVGYLSGPDLAPALETAGSIAGELDAPSLVSVTGDVTAHPFDAPSLTVVGGVLDYWSTSTVPALERAGALTLKDPSVIDLPDLVEVTGRLRGGTYPCVGFSDPVATASTLNLPSLERAGSLALCTQYSGNSWPLATVDLPSLQQVTGPSTADGFTEGLFIGPVGSITNIELPMLASVMGPMEVYFPLGVPVLTEVRKQLTVRAPMTAPAMTRVLGDLDLYSALSADALQQVRGTLYVASATSISFPALLTTGGVRVAASDLTALDLPVLATVATTPAGTGGVRISGSSLTALSIPSLTSIENDLAIVGNTVLTDIDLPLLTSLGAFLRIRNNPNLPTCQATDLRDQLLAAGWTGTATISGNDGTGTCP